MSCARLFRHVQVVLYSKRVRKGGIPTGKREGIDAAGAGPRASSKTADSNPRGLVIRRQRKYPRGAETQPQKNWTRTESRRGEREGRGGRPELKTKAPYREDSLVSRLLRNSLQGGTEEKDLKGGEEDEKTGGQGGRRVGAGLGPSLPVLGKGEYEKEEEDE